MIPCAHINLEKKKLINSTCEEFEEFFSCIELGKEFQKRELFENFKKEYEEYADIQPVRFSRWLKDAAKIKGIRLSERKSGVERFIRLGESTDLDNLDKSFFD